MTESPELDALLESDEASSEIEQVRTGVLAVDQVISAVEGLEERPLEEHVGVFETAHAELRRALDTPTDSSAGPA